MNRRDFVEGIGALTVAAGGAQVLAAPASAAAPQFEVSERSIAQLSQAQAQGETSCEALTRAYLARIERFDRQGPQLRAVLAVNPRVLDEARALDAARRGGRLAGPLHGIPILLKDNIEMAGPLPTTAGSLALAGATHDKDAPVAARLARSWRGVARQGQPERVGELPLQSLGERLERASVASAAARTIRPATLPAPAPDPRPVRPPTCAPRRWAPKPTAPSSRPPPSTAWWGTSRRSGW